MPLTHSYLGTTSVGGSALTMDGARAYVKQVTVPAGGLLSNIEAHLQTTDGSQCTVRPVLYADNAGSPGTLLGFQSGATNSVAFNGRDDWTSFPMMMPFTAQTTVWAGVQASDPTGLALSYETTGGAALNKRVNTYSTAYSSEAGAFSASVSDDSHVYSIRVGVVAGFTAFSTVGRTTVGGSWLPTGSGIHLRKETVPADRLICGVRAHIRHNVLNGYSMAAYLWADSAGTPSTLLHAGPVASGMFLVQNVGRFLHFPVGRWNDAATDYWFGIGSEGPSAHDLAYDATGGNGGVKASRSDAATWTSGDDDYSLHLALAG